MHAWCASRGGDTSARISAMARPLATPLAAAPATRTWRPTPLIRGSVVLHVGAAAAALVRPQWWPWALSAVVADHLLLTATGLVPRSRWLGSNWTRLPAPAKAPAPVTPGAAGERRDAAAVAITIDDGPDPEITPRVLDLLDARGAPATFFCIGERVAQYPHLARAIVAGHHEIGNHSHRHLKRFSLLGPRGLGEEIRRAQQAILDATGERPCFFRAPAGLRNPFLEPVLAREGLQLVSWTRRGFDTVNSSARTVLSRLTRELGSGDILLLHDGHAARNSSGTAVILDVLPKLLGALTVAQLTPVTLHSALAAAGTPQ
jgi:peptidoglycan-N-acetylglucosamine deacetylase